MGRHLSGQRWPLQGRRRRSLGAGLVAVGLLAGGLAACGSSTVVSTGPSTTVKAPPSGTCGGSVPAAAAGATPAGEAATADAVDAFGADLLGRLERVSPDDNVAVAPTNVMDNLAMLVQGARGSTASQILRVLHSSGPAAQLAVRLRDLNAAIAADAHIGSVSLDQANTVWAADGVPLVSGFTSALARAFATGVQRAPMATDPTGATAEINAWVAEHTCGQITKLLAPGMVDPSTVVVLVDALFFHGEWLQRFPTTATSPGPFTLAGGTKVTVPFMRQTLEAEATTSAGLQAVQLPYVGKRFAADAIMPTSGPLDSLTGRSVASALAGLGPSRAINVSLPRFSLTSARDLSPALADLGMPQVFGSDADLSGISPEAGYVKFVQHQVKVTVNEAGTTAAAATATGIQATAVAAPRLIDFDRPFLFVIRDLRTGAIIFSAAVQNPA